MSLVFGASSPWWVATELWPGRCRISGWAPRPRYQPLSGVPGWPQAVGTLAGSDRASPGPGGAEAPVSGPGMNFGPSGGHVASGTGSGSGPLPAGGPWAHAD